MQKAWFVFDDSLEMIHHKQNSIEMALAGRDEKIQCTIIKGFYLGKRKYLCVVQLLPTHIVIFKRPGEISHAEFCGR